MKATELPAALIARATTCAEKVTPDKSSQQRVIATLTRAYVLGTTSPIGITEEGLKIKSHFEDWAKGCVQTLAGYYTQLKQDIFTETLYDFFTHGKHAPKPEPEKHEDLVANSEDAPAVTRDGIVNALTAALKINGVSCYDIGTLADTFIDCLGAAGHAEPEPPTAPCTNGTEWWIVRDENPERNPEGYITVMQWFGYSLRYWRRIGSEERFGEGITPIRRIEHEGLYDEDQE